MAGPFGYPTMQPPAGGASSYSRRPTRQPKQPGAPPFRPPSMRPPGGAPPFRPPSMLPPTPIMPSKVQVPSSSGGGLLGLGGGSGLNPVNPGPVGPPVIQPPASGGGLLGLGGGPPPQGQFGPPPQAPGDVQPGPNQGPGEWVDAGYGVGPINAQGMQWRPRPPQSQFGPPPAQGMG